MTGECEEVIDPRIRRTRQLLREALARLLESKQFEKISVQDISEAATVNRATFYDHYEDKYALLKCMVGVRFRELLAARGIRFQETCLSALKAVVLGVCDYLAGIATLRQGQIEPHMESAVIDVVREMILQGLSHDPAERVASPEMIATTVSWAIYGAAKEWVRTPNHCGSDETVETIAALVSPIFNAAIPSYSE